MNLQATRSIPEQELNLLKDKFKKADAERLALDEVYMETLRKCHEVRTSRVEAVQRISELQIDKQTLENELAQVKAELEKLKSKPIEIDSDGYLKDMNAA